MAPGVGYSPFMGYCHVIELDPVTGKYVTSGVPVPEYLLPPDDWLDDELSA